MLEIDPQDPDMVYFSDGGGLYRSLDGGSTWEEFDRHPSGSFNTLYFNYGGIPTVFAGTGEGIFRRRLGDRVDVQPGVDAALQFTSTQGTTVTVEVPGTAVNQTISLLYIEIPNLANPDSTLVFAGQAFNLNAFTNGEKVSPFIFQTPVVVTIEYSDSNVDGLSEEQLHLMYNDAGTWMDAACGAYIRDLGENWVQVPICHLSQFGLFEFTPHIYLPMVRR
jgi:hypothetical protein